MSGCVPPSPYRSGVIPDELIKAAADEFDTARSRLAVRRSDGRFPLPAINAAAIAVELYLKSLNATSVYSSSNDPGGFRPLSATPLEWGHDYLRQYQQLDWDVRTALSEAFPYGFASSSLEITLEQFKGLFSASRYPFEPGNDTGQFNIDELMMLSSFLREFVEQFEGWAWSTGTRT